MEAFDPGRDVNQQRKARGMALRETIGAKALDLVEAAGREIAAVPISDHAVDELLAEQMDLSVAPEARHRPAHPIGFLGGAPGADNCDLPRLFLKQRPALGFF